MLVFTEILLGIAVASFILVLIWYTVAYRRLKDESLYTGSIYTYIINKIAKTYHVLILSFGLPFLIAYHFTNRPSLTGTASPHTWMHFIIESAIVATLGGISIFTLLLSLVLFANAWRLHKRRTSS